MTVNDAAAATREQPEAIIERVDDRRQAQRRDPRRRQLDRERQPVEPFTDVAGERSLRTIQRRTACLGARLEELEGVTVGVERSDRHHVLALDAERFAARRDDVEIAARLGQLLGRLGRGLDDVFAVVEHEDDPM